MIPCVVKGRDVKEKFVKTNNIMIDIDTEIKVLNQDKAYEHKHVSKKRKEFKKNKSSTTQLDAPNRIMAKNSLAITASILSTGL